MTARTIADHPHHAVLRMPEATVVGDLEQHVDRFRLVRQAGRHLEQTEALAVHVFTLADVEHEPLVYVVVDPQDGDQLGVYATRALADEAVTILASGSGRHFEVEEEPLRGAIDPILLVDAAEGEEG